MADSDDNNIIKNLNALTGVKLLNFINKYNMPRQPHPNNVYVKSLSGEWQVATRNWAVIKTSSITPRPNKVKKKKKNVTQQPAFIARPFLVQQVQPGGPMTNQPRFPAPQNFQAPHHQQESLVDLTDDTAPVTPLPAGGWKPLGGPGESPTGSNLNTKKMSNTLKNKLQVQQIQKQKLNVAMQRASNLSLISLNKQPNATTSARQGENEIKWEVNLVEDSDDEKQSTSTSIQGQSSATDKSNVQNPQSQTRVQGALPNTKLKEAKATATAMTLTSKTEDPANPRTSYSSETGRILRTVTTLDAQTSAEPQKAKKFPPPPKHQRIAPIAHLAGIPRSFLTAEHIAGRCNAIQPMSNSDQDFPNWTPNPLPQESHELKPPIHVQTSDSIAPNEAPQQYSPSDVYDDSSFLEREGDDGSVCSSQSAQKRLSAFQRLGPVTSSKKPKLTINILFNKDREGRNQAVREVIHDTQPEEKYTPVHLRAEILESRDETVDRYLSMWPWKRAVSVRKSVTQRPSKSVMILEHEQMEEAYEKEHAFFQVSVRGYPARWCKEQVLDLLLDSVRGKSFIPCFIEFTTQECKFLVIRCRSALTAIHKLGFVVRNDEVELSVTISQIDLSLNQMDFLPRLVLRKRLAMEYDGERKLSLKEFTLKPDVSHFIYFPLNRLTNQTELMQMQSTVAWDYLTDLDLSHNRLTSLQGFELPKSTPKLKNLDLSHNCLERASALLRCRELALRSLRLEGNPLCSDYTDPAHYVTVLRMIFPGLVEIDDLPINLKGDLPRFKRNHCPEDAHQVVERFLEVFFPLLDMPAEDRLMIEDLYDEKAVLTITYRYNLRYSPKHRYFRNLLLRARAVEEGETDAVSGASSIAKLVGKWPALHHDPYSITADVLHHTDTHTILRVSGILKLTSESLAEDEHLLAFTRTLVLGTRNGAEYKIQNEMLYWDEATAACAYAAFQINSVRLTNLSLQFEKTPDKDLQEKLAEVFMKLTDLDKSASIRCLEIKNWNLKSALKHFVKLLKLDDLDSLKSQHD